MSNEVEVRVQFSIAVKMYWPACGSADGANFRQRFKDAQLEIGLFMAIICQGVLTEIS